MKKFIICILTIILLVGCSQTGSTSQLEIVPPKIDENGHDTVHSSVNTTNLDNYLFRDDVFYCDLRYYSWVLRNGHIAGFTFIPYYCFISVKSETSNKALFRQARKDGIASGEVGSFTPVYHESIKILNKLFPKDKIIFLVSESGLESYYMSCLLTQFGYETKNIYNVGGVTSKFGPLPPYEKVGKHFVKGNIFVQNDIDGSLFEISLENSGLHLIE